MDFVALFGSGKGEMAKRTPVDEELVRGYSARLSDARTDRSAFEDVLSDIKRDARLRAPDIIAIAQRYNGGGKKPSSKTMALTAISKRFVEIVRFHAKNRVAEKVRPW
jgi:hypothetical protein